MVKTGIKTKAKEDFTTSTAVKFGRDIMDVGRTGREVPQVTVLGGGNQ